MPSISVIMGIYNTPKEGMVRLAIESILNQSFSDFEFIICDDGSTDNTYQIVKKIVGTDSRVKLIQNEKNRGLAFTLNHCLEVATGKYIARMDADDIALPDRFKEQFNFLENNKEYDIVGTSAYLIDDSGRWGFRKTKITPVSKDFLFGTQFIHPTIMARREVYESLKGYTVSKQTLRAEDYDLFMRAYASGYKGYNLQIPLYEFREDHNAYRRRSYKFRLDEAKVRYHGFKRLGLLPFGFIYVLKPLIIGLFPQKFLRKLRAESYNNQ